MIDEHFSLIFSSAVCVVLFNYWDASGTDLLEKRVHVVFVQLRRSSTCGSFSPQINRKFSILYQYTGSQTFFFYACGNDENLALIQFGTDPKVSEYNYLGVRYYLDN